MKRKKRLLSLLLALLMLITLLPLGSMAASTVYFTSINDTIRDLNDETMPFWADGMLYIPHTAIDDGSMPKELGIYCSYNREKQVITMMKSRKVLVFDIAEGTVSDGNDNISTGKVIVRGGYAFVPLDMVAKQFGLSYTCTKVTDGYLVRVKSEAAVLSDAKFIDAAAAPMAERYRRYEKAHQPPPAEEPQPQPVPDKKEEIRPVVHTTAYFAFEATDAAGAERILSVLGTSSAFLLGEETLSTQADLLRHLIVSGSALALRVDASNGAEQTISAIERGNARLWAAGNVKTRLVYLENTSDTVTAEVRNAGYCPLSFDLDYSEALPSAAHAASAILAKTERAGSCTVFWGSDVSAAGAVGSTVSRLAEGSCTPMRLNEVNA